jgi:PEGA domain
MTPRSRTAVAEWANSSVSTPLASWYTESVCDAIGDRLFMFDNTGTPSLELLRFRPEFGVAAGFEDGLRERVRALQAFDHPAFSQVRAVERLDSGDLVLVSTVTTGKRLAEIFRSERGRRGVHPAFAAWFIRESVAAIVALQQQVEGIAHTALTPDRVILTPDGRLVVVEHVLGAALERLRLTAKGAQDLGLIVPADGNGLARLDQQADVVQIGFIALSLLLGRRITPSEYPWRVGTLLDEFAGANHGCSLDLVSAMRRWLERALFTGTGGFSSAIDAQNELGDLRSHGGRHAIAFAASATGVEQLAFECPQQLPPADPGRSEPDSTEIAFSTFDDPGAARTGTVGLPPVEPVAAVVAGDVARAVATGHATERHARRWTAGWLVAAFVAMIAIGEAIWLARTGSTKVAATPPASALPAPLVIDSLQPGDEVIVDGRGVGVTPMTLALKPDMRSIHVRRRPTPDAVPIQPASKVNQPVETPATAVLEQAAARERRGGLRVSSPIEIQVLEGDRVLGSSTDGPVVATAGKHELDFVNTEFGYQLHQVVEFKAGQILPMKISPPGGRVSINAVPWALVSIDGNSVGETPLGNVALPVGDHQITFRHPQLGERTQKVVVKANAATRVSAVFTR